MSDSSLDRDPFEAVAESFLERYRAGQHPSIEDYARRHPELADQIRRLLPALVAVEQDLSVDTKQASVGRDGIASQAWRVDDYRILGEIGRGGMGVVYEAEQVSLGRRVALKILPRQIAHDARALERFRREAKSAARLHHTNIVPVFEVGQDGETAYYAMQFIQGRGLDEIIDELALLCGNGRDGSAAIPGSSATAAPGANASALDPVAGLLLTGLEASWATAKLSGDAIEPKPPRTEPFGLATGASPAPVAVNPRGLGSTAIEGPSNSALPGGTEITTTALSGRRRPFFRSVAQIGRQVAQALAYAHSRGVIHRDIKPSNLLLDHSGVVWITDFGLAKAEEDGLTQSGDILGTIRYMAPERLRGEGDARADIYSLGLTLYELLTFRPAFEKSDRLELIERIKTDEPARPRSLDVRIPRDLETIILKAIDKDPAGRYANADAMAEDLRRFLDDESILARRASAAERAWRWARRNPSIAVLDGALAALLVLTTVGSMLAARRFARAADDERALRHEADQARDAAGRRERAERWARYRSNIAEAAASQLMQNSSTGELALEAAPPDYRNWEWSYLHSQLDGSSRVHRVPGLGGDSEILRLSPDASQIAVGSQHGNIHLFEAKTGRVGPVLRGHTAAMRSLAYSPDGKQLASGSFDGTIRIWDPATGRSRHVLRWEGGGATILRYSPDSRRIISTEWPADGKVRLWDASAGRQIAVLGRRPSSGNHQGAIFRPDGRRVVAGDETFLRIFDPEDGRLLSALGPHESSIDQLAFVPGGERLVVKLSKGVAPTSLRDGETGEVIAVLGDQKLSISAMAINATGSRLAIADGLPDLAINLWETAGGRRIRKLSGHVNIVIGLAFSPDGKRLVSSSLDQTSRLWDGGTGAEIAVLRGHTGILRAVAFNPDGSRLVTASADQTIRLWNSADGSLIAVLRGHTGPIDTMAFIAEGSRLVSTSGDDTMRIWDMTLVERNGVLRGHTSYVYDVAFRSDGKQVASAGWDGTIRLWDPDTGRQTALLRHDRGAPSPEVHQIDAEIMTAVDYSADGRRLAAVNRDSGVTLWTIGDAGARRAYTWAAESGDVRAAFSPDGRLAAGSVKGPVRLWDPETGNRLAEFLGHEGRSGDVAFSPDGATLATCGDDGTIRLWDVTTRKAVAVLRGHAAAINRIAFSPDGRLLASGSDDATVRLWDAGTREAVASINIGSKVYGVAFNPDGTRLALGCADTMIRLIDVASRQEVVALRGHGDYVHAVAWSPDGTRLVSGSGDHTVRIWDSLSIQARARVSAGAVIEGQAGQPAKSETATD